MPPRRFVNWLDICPEDYTGWMERYMLQDHGAQGANLFGPGLFQASLGSLSVFLIRFDRPRWQPSMTPTEIELHGPNGVDSMPYEVIPRVGFRYQYVIQTPGAYTIRIRIQNHQLPDIPIVVENDEEYVRTLQSTVGLLLDRLQAVSVQNSFWQNDFLGEINNDEEQMAIEFNNGIEEPPSDFLRLVRDLRGAIARHRTMLRELRRHPEDFLHYRPPPWASASVNSPPPPPPPSPGVRQPPSASASFDPPPPPMSPRDDDVFHSPETPSTPEAQIQMRAAQEIDTEHSTPAPPVSPPARKRKRSDLGGMSNEEPPSPALRLVRDLKGSIEHHRTMLRELRRHPEECVRVCQPPRASGSFDPQPPSPPSPGVRQPPSASASFDPPPPPMSPRDEDEFHAPARPSPPEAQIQMRAAQEIDTEHSTPAPPVSPPARKRKRSDLRFSDDDTTPTVKRARDAESGDEIQPGPSSAPVQQHTGMPAPAGTPPPDDTPPNAVQHPPQRRRRRRTEVQLLGSPPTIVPSTDRGGSNYYALRRIPRVNYKI